MLAEGVVGAALTGGVHVPMGTVGGSFGGGGLPDDPRADEQLIWVRVCNSRRQSSQTQALPC